MRGKTWSTKDPFIFQYTRAQAIEDGSQGDVTQDKGAAVYKTSVFVTAPLWAAIEKGQGKDAEVASARLWDVCFLVAKSGRTISPAIRESSVKIGARRFTVRGECGPVDIDDSRPAITLGFPEDF